MAFDFPNAPSDGSTFSPAGGPVYTYTGGVWKALYPNPPQVSLVPDAPANGNTYARQNNAWVSLTGGAVDATPPGTVIMFAGTAPPTGYLKANGASLLRAMYPNLFAAIGTLYGAADGTHFNVPDLRGEFVRAFDDARGVDSGRAMGSAQAEATKAHTHTASADAQGTHSHGAVTGS